MTRLMLPRRSFLIGAAALAAHTALADGVYNPGGQPVSDAQDGLLGAKSSAAPFVPLAGATIDMNFATGQYFGGTLATLMDGTQSNAIGALLAAMSGTDVSVLLSLKTITPAPDGSYIWINGTGGTAGLILQGTADTTFRSRRIATSLIGTLGAGAFSAGPCKIGCSYTASNRAVVGNNGTIVTDAQVIGGFTGIAFLNVLAHFNRLTIWAPSISNAALAAFTV